MSDEIRCEICGRTDFKSNQGLLTHIARAHKPVPTMETEDIFERVGRATTILFPNADPSRYIEIAEWQKATMKVMSRS